MNQRGPMVAALGIFACSFGTALGAAVVNLIPNASFEQGDPEHADQPLGFKPSKFDAVVGQTGAGVIFGWEPDAHGGRLRKGSWRRSKGIVLRTICGV